MTIRQRRDHSVDGTTIQDHTSGSTQSVHSVGNESQPPLPEIGPNVSAPPRLKEVGCEISIASSKHPSDHPTMADQRIVSDVSQIDKQYGDCFAMAVVSKKERSGVLAGVVTVGAKEASR